MPFLFCCCFTVLEGIYLITFSFTHTHTHTPPHPPPPTHTHIYIYIYIYIYIPSRRSLKTAAPEIYLAENFPNEIEYRRRQLYPMVAAANRADEYRQKVRLTGDKLIVNNQRYSHTTVNKLPNKLHPKTLSERTSESVIVVGGITSQHHPLSRSDHQIICV